MGPELVGHISHFACGAALFGKAAVFRKVVKKAGSTPERTLCIGDEVRDIEAAHEAGCACGAVGWGFATPAILDASGPDHLYAEPQDIARCVMPAEQATQRA